MCVCLLITNVSCAKTAEPIEIPFGIWTRVGPGIRVLTGGFGSTTGNGTFGGYISACPNLTAVDILNVVRCDAAFGYQSVYTVATCSIRFYEPSDVRKTNLLMSDLPALVSTVICTS